MADDVETNRRRGADAARWIAESETLLTSSGHNISFRRRGQGPTVLLLHGFPTWSYDYAAVAADLELDHEVVTLDFLGFGASDKPRRHNYSVPDSADVVEAVVSLLGVKQLHLVVHDYGGIVGQELLDRHRRGVLGFGIRAVTVLNCAIVYSAYRPVRLQKLLIMPVVGRVVAARNTPGRLRAGLDRVRGTAKLTDFEFENLWLGISRGRGHTLAHRLIRYNAERDRYHQRWEAALRDWRGPLTLVWGQADPVSGRHVLEQARKILPQASVVALDEVGHFPQSEAPEAVATAIRSQR
ncbi:alpha/beta hydrolase [Streptomyces misionensis]|uniref:alpha/beta fold hydrolase n=1 Tax=Streptomyces misionensis TaxID=67331 RepID=UPI0033E6F837